MWNFCKRISEYLKAASLVFLLHHENISLIFVSCDLKVYLFLNGFGVVATVCTVDE